jgi:hypothetical protein
MNLIEKILVFVLIIQIFSKFPTWSYQKLKTAILKHG